MAEKELPPKGLGEYVGSIVDSVDTGNLDHHRFHFATNKSLTDAIMLRRGVIDGLGTLLEHPVVVGIKWCGLSHREVQFM